MSWWPSTRRRRGVRLEYRPWAVLQIEAMGTAKLEVLVNLRRGLHGVPGDDVHRAVRARAGTIVEGQGGVLRVL
jgi:hypothetical protein